MPAFVPVVYSGGAPVLTSGGAQRVACAHLAEWLQVYDALQVARGRGHVTFYQTMGGADASAGTHTCGSAFDLKFTGNAAILDAREMGAAVWPRLVRYGWTTGEHVHGLISCGDNGCNGYQYTAYWLGMNGLGLNGQGGTDPLPKPSQRRTWQQGIAWAKAQMTKTPILEEDTMKILSSTGKATVLVGGSGGVASLPSQEHVDIALKMASSDPAALINVNAREYDLALNLAQVLRESAAPKVTWEQPPVTALDPSAFADAVANEIHDRMEN